MSGQSEMVVIIDERESVVASAAKDVLSFGGLIATAWVLNTQMPPSGWLNAALAISWMLWLAGKGATRTKKMTIEQARAHLDDLTPLPTTQETGE